jgi:hypothetical protein
VLSGPLSAQTELFCDRLGQALATTKGAARTAENVAKMLSGFGPSPAACAFSLDLSGSTSANCHWAFSYRSDAATSGFDAMLATLTACADPAFAVETDQPVNHPDFYDLRLLRIAGGEVGLSIKDKVGLNQTYIFLRLTPTP